MHLFNTGLLLRLWSPYIIFSNTSALAFYGLFLISCGIVAVMFIGLKAKTALMSGGMSGAFALAIAYWSYTGGSSQAHLAGMLLSLALFCVFAWRSTKTLFKVFELIPTAHPDLKGKGIAFLIISLMAVVSVFVFALLVMSLYTQGTSIDYVEE